MVETGLKERFARLIDEHGAALARLAAAYEWDPVEREDLLQEIGLALWRALPSFRGESSERTFVFRIAHNRGLSHRWQRRRNMLDLSVAGELVDARSDPSRRVTEQEEHDRLAAAIRRLPEIYRAAVVLTLEGLSQREVGEVLGARENTIAARLSRARRLLRDLLEEKEPAS